jgi:uncharacterized membrane protein
MKKQFLILILFTLLSSFCYAATIKGSIYDLTLSKVNNVIVEIDTIPHQRYVSINGTYSFDVSNGKYEINTVYNDKNIKLAASENITVVDEGIFVIDLFLYPTFSDEETLYDDLNIEINDLYESESTINFFLIVPLLFALLIGLVAILKRGNNEDIEKLDRDVEKLLLLLKKNNGRMTQKEIRKHFAMGEAKISLLITELEALNKIKKIKKGRSNVIILNK